MKKSFLLLTACAIMIRGNAQHLSALSAHRQTFAEIKEQAEKKLRENAQGKSEKDGEWQRFQRWEWFARHRTLSDGTFPENGILYKEYKNLQSKSTAKSGLFTGVLSADWSYIGPHSLPENGGGAGRLNCVAIHPSNPDILWVGAACGGLWKSANGGQTWTTTTDLLPSISISDIAINPVNPQIMYIATGDKFGYVVGLGFWGGQYSAGILKSIDGGVTWNPTGNTYAIWNNKIIQQLLIDTDSPETLFAATSQGIFKTQDGGNNWTMIKSGVFYDIEFHPASHLILYAAEQGGFMRSMDGGQTWSYTPGVYGGYYHERMCIAVTPANPNSVYVWSDSLYYSDNSGASFVFRTAPKDYVNDNNYYYQVLEASPFNANILVAGGVHIAHSLDGGLSWQYSVGGHPDYHAFRFDPADSEAIYACDDGGLHRIYYASNAYMKLSEGLNIKQYYRLGSSNLTPEVLYAGAQDNGTDRITESGGVRVGGGDGMECLVDYTDDNIVFASRQQGNFSKSTDGGNNFSPLSVNGCAWTSPIVMDPANPNVLYVGGEDVYKSTDKGETWTGSNSWNVFDGTCLYSLEICAGLPQHLYAATYTTVYKSANGGTSWTNITGTLPVGWNSISGIAVKNDDPVKAWVTLSGFATGKKVFYTPDGGSTWINVSGSLPNIPVNCIEYQNGTNDNLYIGTDLGVFYTNDSLNDWVSYNSGLPNVIVDELEIHYSTSRLRAATYGRGLWESDLQVSTLKHIDASVLSVLSPSADNCDTAITPEILIRNSGTDTLFSVDLYYAIDGQTPQVYHWSGTLPFLQADTVQLTQFILSSGSHYLKIFSSCPNTFPDQNPMNDTISYTFVLGEETGIQTPIQEGFENSYFPPPLWETENSSDIWAFSYFYGGYGLSPQSARARFYYTYAGNEDALILPSLDLINLPPPVYLYFDLAYAPYDGGGTVYMDSLFIDAYTDCQQYPEERIYSKGIQELATAPAYAGIFHPTSSQWRTDSIDLTSFSGNRSQRFKFVAKSGYGNVLYIDNVNVYSPAVGILPLLSVDEIRIYPNPAANSLNISIPPSYKISAISVMDARGRVVIERKISESDGPATLDVSNLREGMYFIQISDGKTHFSHRKVAIVR